MAKPRIFISSTYYDLKHLRAEFDDLGMQIGFEPILFEHGKIAYDGTLPLEQSIFQEIELSDIVVSIVGSRYGSRSVEKTEYSITEREIRYALELGKQMFFFVDAGVRTASEIYLDNEQLFQESKQLGEGLKWRHVENIEVFHLIKFIESLNKNNAIFSYETSTEVMSILREQLAGLFKSLLQKQSRDLINTHVSGLVEAITKVENIVEYFKKQEASNKETMDDILFSNHPLFKRIQNALNLSIRIIFDDKKELNELLVFSKYVEVPAKAIPDPKRAENYFVWASTSKKSDKRLLGIKKELFDERGRFQTISTSDWKDDMLIVE